MQVVQESAEATIEKMWSKNPFFMLIILLMLVPLICSFVFCFYILQSYNASLNKLSDNIMFVKVELEKQTGLLVDIKDSVQKTEMQTFFDSNYEKRKKK